MPTNKKWLSFIVRNNAKPLTASSIQLKNTPPHSAAPEEAAELEKMKAAAENFIGAHSLAMKLDRYLMLQKIVKLAIEHANNIPVEDENAVGSEQQLRTR